MEGSMAPVGWKDLPGDILSIIAKINSTDIRRLRFVCTSWRCSLPPPPEKPISFPLKVPSICAPPECDCPDGENGCYILRQHTLYCFSSLSADPSNGWMLKVSETTNPNVYSLLRPLSAKKMYYPPNTIPKCLNLLDYIISEVCKSYSLDTLNHKGSGLMLNAFEKVIVLWDYLEGCNFAILSLQRRSSAWIMRCWKFGDESWTLVDTKGHKICDMTFFDGKCYAISIYGVLFCFDSNLQPTVVASPLGFPRADGLNRGHRNLLVECKSELYSASMVRFRMGVNFSRLSLNLGKFNKRNGNWDCVGDLGDNVFLLGEDLSVGVSAKDFEGFNGNSIYLTEWCSKVNHAAATDVNDSEVYGDMAGIYHLDNPLALRIKQHMDFPTLNWRPPSWLMPIASSLEP